MARVFFALQPDAASLRRLGRLQQQVSAEASAWRIIPAESMHLTLAYVGERSAGAIATLIEAAAPITFEPMVQPGRGWLWLPDPARPRVLALGVEADARLRSLAARVWSLLDEVGWQRPERPFLPHVTLARMRGGVRDREARRILDAPPDINLRWASFGLFASRTTPSGVCYRRLWSAASAGSSGDL